MAKPSAPCRECEKRSPTCHGECSEYQQFVTELNDFNEAMRKDHKDREWMPMRLKAIERAVKRNRRSK